MKETCDCSEICGWTKQHTLEKESVYWVCSNCGTELISPDEKESMIFFNCEIHGERKLIRQ